MFTVHRYILVKKTKMFNFEKQYLLFLLLLIPVLVAVFVLLWYEKKKTIGKFGNPTLIQKLMPGVSKYKQWLKFGLLMMAIAFVAIGLANPRWGNKKLTHQKVDVFIALDISTSMLATDMRPDRMERARQFALKLIQQLAGERIGVIIFAGNAHLHMPLTTDYNGAQLYIKSATPDMVSIQGTAISEAIDLANYSFSEKNEFSKALVIISDGENHDEEALMKAAAAAANGMTIFTVGVGTEVGSEIPVDYGGRRDYKRDRAGNIVKSALNEEMLVDLAEMGEGAYFNLKGSDELIVEALRAKIDKIEKYAFDNRSFEDYESYFQYFIGLALLLLIIEFLLSQRTSKWMEGKDIFKTE